MDDAIGQLPNLADGMDGVEPTSPTLPVAAPGISHPARGPRCPTGANGLAVVQLVGVERKQGLLLAVYLPEEAGRVGHPPEVIEGVPGLFHGVPTEQPCPGSRASVLTIPTVASALAVIKVLEDHVRRPPPLRMPSAVPGDLWGTWGEHPLTATGPLVAREAPLPSGGPSLRQGFALGERDSGGIDVERPSAPSEHVGGDGTLAHGLPSDGDRHHRWLCIVVVHFAAAAGLALISSLISAMSLDKALYCAWTARRRGSGSRSWMAVR